MNESTELGTDAISLLKAVFQSRLRLTRLLLEGGAYINESNELGETPLMVACKTQHTDAQSVPKPKMVRYLLENGADPNIQDKTGKTALMHACLEQTDPEILSLLLNSGADPTLEDRTGSSALVYAVSSGNGKILRLLLGACKAKGKEFIIIPTNKIPSAPQRMKQYLNVPPTPHLEERLSYTSVSSCRFSTEAKMETPTQAPLPYPSTQTCSSLLSLSDSHCVDVSSCKVISQTSCPNQPLISDLDRRLSFEKVDPEKRTKISSLLLQQNQASSLIEEQVENATAEEEQPIRFKVLAKQRRPSVVSRHQSIDVKDATGLLKSLEHLSVNENAEGRRKCLGKKMSYDSAASSLHATSHPNLHQDSLPFSDESSPGDEDCSDTLRQLNISSLQNVVNRRNIGMDHYSSDSQLLQVGSRERMLKTGGAPRSGPEKHKQMSCRPPTLSGSKESLESSGPRRGVSGLERRGSGALLLDHIAHTRPGYLPPLNPHVPIPDIGVSPSFCTSSGRSPVLTGSKSVLPSVSVFSQDLKGKKPLWRRHSMQSEQIKQLVGFRDAFGH